MPSEYERLLLRTRNRMVDRRGWRPINTLEDRGGTHCIVMKNSLGEQFYVVAKKEMWEDEASLLQKTVQRAADYDSKVVCYYAKSNEFIVFDAGYVRREAREKRTKSKTHVTDWYVLPAHHGVDLDAYLRNEETPSKVDDTQMTTLRRFEE